LSRVGFGVLVVLAHVFAFAPVLMMGALYGALWRAEALTGHWPVAWVDDPKFVVRDDALYDVLYLAVPVFFVASYIALFAVPFLTGLIALKLPRYPRLWLALLVLAFVVGCFFAVSDPGERFRWWLD
jgi:hypothetical protein